MLLKRCFWIGIIHKMPMFFPRKGIQYLLLSLRSWWGLLSCCWEQSPSNTALASRTDNWRLAKSNQTTDGITRGLRLTNGRSTPPGCGNGYLLGRVRVTHPDSSRSLDHRVQGPLGSVEFDPLAAMATPNFSMVSLAKPVACGQDFCDHSRFVSDMCLILFCSGIRGK